MHALSALNFYVCLTLVCWGIWGILDKKALGTSSHLGVLLRLYSMALWQAPLIYCCMAMIHPGFHLNYWVWFWTALASASRLVSFAAYLYAMSITDASLVLGVTAGYPIITQLLAVACLGEKLVWSRMWGAVAIAIGVLAIASSKGKAAALDKGAKVVLLVCVVIATCSWGLWGILDKQALAHGKPVEIWFAESVWEVVIVLIAVGVSFFRHYRVEITDGHAWSFAFLSAMALIVGKLTYLSALNLATASYVITITGCYPLLMYIFALLFLPERFDTMRFLGILMVVAGGVAVQLTQAM